MLEAKCFIHNGDTQSIIYFLHILHSVIVNKSAISQPHQNSFKELSHCGATLHSYLLFQNPQFSLGVI